MTIAIKKPILVAGVSLSFLLWLWQSFQSHVSEIGEYGVWGLIIVSGCLWLWQPKNKVKNIQKFIDKPITETEFNQVFQNSKNLINTWETEIKTLKYNSTLNENNLLVINQEKNNLLAELENIKQYINNNEKLKVAIIGSNKFSVYTLPKILEELPNLQPLNFTVVDNLFSAVDDQNLVKENLLLNYDLVLFLVHGDLTESEKQILIDCRQQQQKILLLFNQVDYNSPEEKNIIFEQLKQRIYKVLEQENLLIISTNNQTIKVKKYQDDKNYEEWEEITNPKYENLTERLNLIINNNLSELILNTAYRKAIKYQQNINNKINQVRKEKAIPLIEKYQFIAATATFANPVASLDLLATAAINTQMIIDLGNIYQQKFSFNQAQNVAVTLAKLMMKLGIVEVSTQAITAILKTNAITFVAGGIIQGVSTAYLTKICGLSLVEYFANNEVISEGETLNIEAIKTKLQSIFNQYQQQNILTKFVNKTAVKLAVQE